MDKDNRPLSRRQYVRNCFAASCGFYATLNMAPATSRRAFAQEKFGQVESERPYGRIEKLADGVWALVSTPFTKSGAAGDRTTHSNGGFIVGDEHILAIDSYRTSAGAQFVAEACKALTGRLPTWVVHTHFHFDHVGGTRGLMAAGANPEIVMTQRTRELASKFYLPAKPDPKDNRFLLSGIEKWGSQWTDASKIIDQNAGPIELDLGGRTVTISPMVGHTQSDLVIRDQQTNVLFGGDLIWDGIFPNLMSAEPIEWQNSIKSILASKPSIIVPGHGSATKADSPRMTKFAGLMAEIEKSCRGSFAKGATVDEAAASIKIPDSLGQWQYFRDGFHLIAAETWFRALSKDRQKNDQ